MRESAVAELGPVMVPAHVLQAKVRRATDELVIAAQRLRAGPMRDVVAAQKAIDRARAVLGRVLGE